MHLKFIVPIVAALAFAGSAVAQDGPKTIPGPGAGPGPNWAAHHANMCNNQYAGAVGRLAALEVQLKLTSAQKPAFDRWRNVKLSGAKAEADNCAGMMAPGGDRSVVEAHKMQIAKVEARLADLKAETPALDALANALTPDQLQILKRAGFHAMHERGGRMGRMFDRQDDMHRMHDGHGGGHGNRPQH
jgi:hypothetical protein